MTQEDDPKHRLLAEVGDLSGVEIFHNQVLVTIYKRPEKTAGGIYLTATTLDEDEFQGKIGLIVTLGPTAGKPDGEWFTDTPPLKQGDWVIFRPSDGWGLKINGVMCRVLNDTSSRWRVDRPDRVW
jgi:co-chaperonin GroES (HSP10)